jgi:hypothetical protein
MMRHRAGRLLLFAALVLLPVEHARAGNIEIAPFIGLGYGGALESLATRRQASIGAGLQYGGTVDVAIGRSWAVELLFSRQATDLESVPRVGLAVERYLAGVREEKGEGRIRFLGVFLLGLTRLVPDGLGTDERFTAAVGLGLRTSLSPRIGLRADARGYYAFVTSGGGIACVNGSCLFAFGSSGMWQGDLTAALVLKL